MILFGGNANNKNFDNYQKEFNVEVSLMNKVANSNDYFSAMLLQIQMLIGGIFDNI